MIHYLLSKHTVDTSSRHTLSCGFITYGLKLCNDTYSKSVVYTVNIDKGGVKTPLDYIRFISMCIVQLQRQFNAVSV